MPDSPHEVAEPDSFTRPLIEKLRRHPKRIVFSDGDDPRVLRAAAAMVREKTGTPIVLGDPARIRALAAELGVDLSHVNAHEPASSTDLPVFCKHLRRIQRYRGIEMANACEVLEQPAYFGAMMIQYGQADGLVAGARNLPTVVFRPLLQLVQANPHIPRVFSAVVQVAPHLQNFGRDGVLFMADCGLNPEPTVEHLASIAVETGLMARHYLGRRVRVALLSHSTKGSSNAGVAPRVNAATALARQKAAAVSADLEIDGELQVDVALDPGAAEVKLPERERRPSADVLVFPSLDAAHIAFKLLEHIAGARTYGQFVQGLMRPAAQVARTMDATGIFGTALAVGVEAIKYHEAYPEGEAS